MDKDSKIIIIGAGIFGLSTAFQLASEGYHNVVVLDRHMPPVPDGSSSDISRIVRFDYADDDYLELAYEAYMKWRDTPRYKGIFFPAEYILVSQSQKSVYEQDWISKTTAALDRMKLPWTKLESPEATRKQFPVLTGNLASPGFSGYNNHQAGWADAAKAVMQLRNDCLALGVSFICGRAGTVVGFEEATSATTTTIIAARTLSGARVNGDHFVLAAGAWAAGLVPMYNSTLATAQVLGYMRLTPAEMDKYRSLPIYINSSTGWFTFPPHQDTQMLKMAIHGWGYTRTPAAEDLRVVESNVSAPPLIPPRERRNFAPADAEVRLRQGLREILPELGDRPFEKLAMCWYTDSPTGDFVMDWHPDYANLFIGGAGSGHAFKFLPILGNYMSLALKGRLPPRLAQKWRFRRDYEAQKDSFKGDGSRGGPVRRELQPQERAKL